MGTKLYVGNLSYSTTEEGLRQAFAADGRQVVSVSIITDRMSGRPRGFAFRFGQGNADDLLRHLESVRRDDVERRRWRLLCGQRRSGRSSGDGGRDGLEKRASGTGNAPGRRHARKVYFARYFTREYSAPTIPRRPRRT